MPQSCDTRWYSKKKGVHHFKTRLESTMFALDNIVQDDRGDEVVHCKGYLRELRSFKTALLLVILDEVLGEVNCLSEYLQCPDLIFTRAVELSRAVVSTLRRMRSPDAFERFWEQTEQISAAASIPSLSRDESPSPKRKRVAPTKLNSSVILTTTGSRETQAMTHFISMRILFYKILDTFCAEIEKRLIDNEALLELFDASNPHHENFLGEESLRMFCKQFTRFNLDETSLVQQAVVARSLLQEKNIGTSRGCLEYLLPMKAGFHQLVPYFQMVLSFPVTSASCERSFSALKRIKTYLRSTMGDKRLSALAVLSIERDLTDDLFNSPERVVDRFAETGDRRLVFTC